MQRNSDGYWTHPEFPDLPESISLEEAQNVFRPLGVKIDFTLMTDELDEEHPACVNYDAGNTDISAWAPVIPPNGFLLSIHDTEDGPVAIIAMPLALAA